MKPPSRYQLPLRTATEKLAPTTMVATTDCCGHRENVKSRPQALCACIFAVERRDKQLINLGHCNMLYQLFAMQGKMVCFYVFEILKENNNNNKMSMSKKFE